MLWVEVDMENAWQLFESVEGWEAASARLDRTLEAVLVGKRVGSEADASAAYDEWREFAWELRMWGAADTEGSDEAAYRISKALRVLVPQRPWIESGLRDAGLEPVWRPSDEGKF